MAKRPVFIPDTSAIGYVRSEVLEFQWFPGFAVSQKQKSISALHESVRTELKLELILEVSSKSHVRLGVALSAFNLDIDVPGHGSTTVECAFQGSKVFADGGPYTDLYSVEPQEAKRDERLRSSGALIAFEFAGVRWDLMPTTAFYDWLYLSALSEYPGYTEQLVEFDAFTDIEFNPAKSLNCQARSCALYVALHRTGALKQALGGRTTYLGVVAGSGPSEDDTGIGTQPSLW